MRRWTGTRRAVAALALLSAVGAVVAIGLGVGSSPPASPAAVSGSSSANATVERRNLVETDTEPGTLSYAGAHTVYNRLSGTVTWLPAVGQVIAPGQALFRVGGQPVTLMSGGTPAYRVLGPSDSDGPDILELNRNLVALGFNPGGLVVDDAWQSATTQGIDLLQASLGQAETGVLKLGSVVFLPGSQTVSTVNAQLGSEVALTLAEGRREFVSLTTTGTTPRSNATPHGTDPPGAVRPGPTPNGRHGKHGHSKPPITVAALLALLKAEAAQLRALEAELRAAQPGSNPPVNGSPATNGGHPSGGGGNPSGGGGNPSGGGSPAGSVNPTSGTGGDGPATAVLTTSSTRLVVTVRLDPSKQSEARLGAPVRVEMPSGETVSGRVSAVSAVAQSSTNTNDSGNAGNGNGDGGPSNNGSGSSTTVPVTITLSSHRSGGGVDQASVSVNFVQARARNVLSVPVTALLATQGGGYAVQDAASRQHLIPVTPGLFAAGYVQISGPGLHPGLKVIDSQG